MQVLLIVVTMLMLMTVLTYARLATFRASMTSHAQFEHYVQHLEKRYLNQQADRLYRAIHIPRGKREHSSEKNNMKGDAKLPVFALKEETAGDQSVKIILTNLIQDLYREHEFYRSRVEKRPQLAADLVHSFQKALQSHKELPASVDELLVIDLEDSELNHIFYQMLKGTPHLPEGGYPSLLQYLSVQKKKLISIYLAPKEILLAIYQNPDTVNAIVDMRCQLFAELKTKKVTASEAKQQFEANFRVVPGAIGVEVIDFSVNLTRPDKCLITLPHEEESEL